MSHLRSRRKFLYAVGGAGIVSAAGMASMGAHRSATEIDHRRSQMESPIEVVRRFCAAVVRQYRDRRAGRIFHRRRRLPQYPAGAGHRQGGHRETTIASFIRPGAPGIEGIQFRVINIAANGPVVMTERVDVFKLPDKSFELPSWDLRGQ